RNVAGLTEIRALASHCECAQVIVNVAPSHRLFAELEIANGLGQTATAISEELDQICSRLSFGAGLGHGSALANCRQEFFELLPGWDCQAWLTQLAAMNAGGGIVHNNTVFNRVLETQIQRRKFQVECSRFA